MFFQSDLLRHGAVKEGLPIGKDGFVAVEDILQRPDMKKYSIADIQDVQPIF